VCALSVRRGSLGREEVPHMTTSALGPRRGGWRRPVSLPADLAELRGPLTGVCGCPWVCMRPAKGPLEGSI
jgi:hypothetical protein